MLNNSLAVQYASWFTLCFPDHISHWVKHNNLHFKSGNIWRLGMFLDSDGFTFFFNIVLQGAFFALQIQYP